MSMGRHRVFRILGTALAVALLLSVGLESVSSRHDHDGGPDAHCPACQVAANHAGMAPAPQAQGLPPLPETYARVEYIPLPAPASHHRDAVYLRGPPTV